MRAEYGSLRNAMSHQLPRGIGFYEGNSISKLQIQVATYVFELSAGNCHR